MDHATKSWWNAQLARRPWWMNLLFFFCLYMAVVHTPLDLFCKPVARDEEVWFGILFRGWAAKLLAIPHGAIYALGAYGFWRMRPWMLPWAAAYAAQVALSMLIWGIVHLEGFGGMLVALFSPLPFLGLEAALFFERERFEAEQAGGAEIRLAMHPGRMMTCQTACLVLLTNFQEKVKEFLIT